MATGKLPSFQSKHGFSMAITQQQAASQKERLYTSGQVLQRRITFLPATRGDAHSSIPPGLKPLKPIRAVDGEINGGEMPRNGPRPVGSPVLAKEGARNVLSDGGQKRWREVGEAEGERGGALKERRVEGVSGTLRPHGRSAVELQWKTIRPIVSEARGW